MTLTIHIHNWILPVGFTVMSFMAVCFSAFLERNDNGWLSGFGTFLVFIGASVCTLVAWIVWALMILIK